MEPMQSRTSWRYNISSAALAFMIWGGWAFYVNDGFGSTVRTISAITQGTASMLITLVMVRVVAWIFNRLPANGIRLVVPAVLTVAITGSALVLVHSLVGTPKIAHTVAPALTVAFLFCAYTAIKLHRQT